MFCLWFFVCRFVRVLCCLLFRARCLMLFWLGSLVVCCSLFAARSCLDVVCCVGLLYVVRCALFVVRCLLCVVSC